MIERCIFVTLSVALVASLAGFLLFVPVLPNFAVTVVLAGLFGMFWLGVQVGRRPQDAETSNGGSSDGNQLSLS